MAWGRGTWIGLLGLCAGAAGALGQSSDSSGRLPAPPSLLVQASPDTLLYINPFEVLVTAARLQIPLRQNPAATSVVGPRELGSMPRTVAADEALRTVPGVRIDDQADDARVHISIRGQGILTERGIRGIKVLLDGLPLNDPTGVAPDLYDVDWSQVGRIEVLRGPSAALYGGGGSGGVINISTAEGGPKPLQVGASTVFGSHGFYKAATDIGGTHTHANYRLSFSRTQGDGYRDHTAFAGHNVYGKTIWTPTSSVRLTQVLGWTDYFDQNAEGLNIVQVRENPRQANPDAGKFDEFYKTNRAFAGLTGRVALAGRQEVQFSGYYRITRYQESVPSAVMHRAYLSPGLSVQYTLRSDLAGWKNHLSAGSDLQWQTIDEYKLANLGAAREDSTTLSNQSIAQHGVGVFVLDRLELGAHWGLLLSGRHDDIRSELTDLRASSTVNLSGSKDFRKTTGRVGLGFTPMPEVNLYVNWGQGFLPPATEELANNPVHQGGFNEGLSPATSQGEEIGARGTLTDMVSYDLAAFHLDTEKDFDRYRTPERPLETFYRNLGDSRRYGLEALLRCRPMRTFAASVAYTYSNFKYTKPESNKDNWLPNSPQHQLVVDLEHEPLPGLTLGVSCEAQTRWYIDSRNSASVSGFTLWDGRVAYAWKLAGLTGDVSISGRNLFARKFMAFTEPDPDGNSYFSPYPSNL